MKYYSYNEYDPSNPLSDSDGGYVVTKSEDEIIKEYWPYWYEQMCKKYERAYVDETYSHLDCIDDWVVVHWAWEVKD